MNSRNNTGRIQRPPTNTRPSTSNTRPPTPSTTDSLGSTSGSLLGSGGAGGGGGGGTPGGGGMSEFGLVLQDAAKPGALVKKGDVVAEFDRQYMLIRLDDYRASLAQMEASVSKLRAELEVEKKAHAQKIGSAKAILDKALLDLKTIPVLGDIDAERVKLSAEEAQAQYKQFLSEVKFVEVSQQAQLRTAEIDLQEARVELRRAEANADRMLLKAPINGLVVMQTIFRGSEFAQVQPGDQLFPGMMFMQIVDPSSMIINASINQADVETLKIGAKAKVRFDAYPGLELPAHVYSVAAMTRPGGQRSSYVKEIPVVLKLDHIDHRVIPDLSVSCDIIIEQEDDAVVAPLGAVFKDASSRSSHVYVKSGDTWEKREVELGMSNNIAVSVRTGLRPGEIVATELPPLESGTGPARASLGQVNTSGRPVPESVVPDLLRNKEQG
jgi:HlyD family secretion protein